MTQLVSYKIENGVAVIKIDNRPLNVMNKQVQNEIHAIIREIKHDDEVVCAVLYSAGTKAFIAGADIKEFPTMIGNPAMRSQVMEIHAMMNELNNLPKPTIAVLDGLTFGGGCELALTFDIRIAEAHATFGFPEVKLGLFPGGGGTQRLPRLVGEAKAKEMMYTGDPIDAETAEKIGLVNHVVPTGHGLEMAMKLAEKIANKSLQALSRIKLAINDGQNESLANGIEREATLFNEVFQTEDIKEGVEAFIEKRKPNFKHK